ncbi:outer membrane lipoprotein-sorting protein [Sulfurimonas sp.]|uniref:outer membrane lipoprotein-sorting protein n=1 Tax=Sulfurimonas sp. TaxID=2022749 RepID=UPI003D09EBE7
MILRDCLIAISLFSSTLVAQSAQEIYEQSTKLFAYKNMRFEVQSVIKTDDSKELRSFLIAQEEEENNNSSLLIRFSYPKDIACTSILSVQKDDQTTNYVYFPALDKVRIIPKKEQNSEVFGLGISYADLQTYDGIFTLVDELKYDGKEFYKISKQKGKYRSYYFIDKNDKVIDKIEFFKRDILEKEVFIDKVTQFQDKPLVTQWHVIDHKNNKTYLYRIKLDSLQTKPSTSLFYKNRLEQCNF